MGYSIKAMASKANLSPNVLRYYEKEGLLPHVMRTKGGIRHYSDEDLEWLSLICCLKNTGMSISQIREFVSLSQQGPETLRERCALLIAHRRGVEEHIGELYRHLEKVAHKIACYTEQYEAYRTSGAEGKSGEGLASPAGVAALPAPTADPSDVDSCACVQGHTPADAAPISPNVGQGRSAPLSAR